MTKRHNVLRGGIAASAMLVATSVGLPVANAAQVSADTPAAGSTQSATGCGSLLGPELAFDGLGHFVVTMGFTGAKRAIGFSFTEYITVENGGQTHYYVPNQTGTLLFRSSLTKRYIGNVPATGPTTIDVLLLGTYTVAGVKIACIVAGSTSGGVF